MKPEKKVDFVVPPAEEIPPQLQQAEMLRQRGEPDEAMRIANNYLNDHIGDVGAITIAALCLFDAGRIGMAQALFKQATALKPEMSGLWNNLGLCYQEGADLNEGEACFIKALNRDPDNALAYNNLAQLYVNQAQPVKALNCAEKAIALDPQLPDARYNKGLALLQQGQWKEGWQGYEYNLGSHRARKERVYGHIPRWTGVNDLTLIAYGEQGIGDEISFASCLPDLMKHNQVVIECDNRLAGLFARSFPCPVFGTRFDTSITWPKSFKVDASVAFGSLPKFYRNHDSDFTGEPYLIADPQRRLMYRALLDSLGSKLKVGIAWTGGLKNTGKDRRSMLLYDLLPILRQDATFISLQYRDAGEIEMIEENHGIKVHHWPYIVQTKDYDDTAALVAELDLVITVTQAVVHLAGALGKPCWVLTPKAPMWRYGLDKDTMPWYKSVKLYRQKQEWVHVIGQIAHDLRDMTLARILH